MNQCCKELFELEDKFYKFVRFKNACISLTDEEVISLIEQKAIHIANFSECAWKEYLEIFSAALAISPESPNTGYFRKQMEKTYAIELNKARSGNSIYNRYDVIKLMRLVTAKRITTKKAKTL
jgi:hypothetical protein